MQNPTTATRQNRVTVRYVDPHGHQLNDSLSLFGAVGSDYHINIPSFEGFWLTDADAPVDGVIPGDHRLVITLTYTKLGTIHLQQADHTEQVLSVTTQSDDAARIKPVQLPQAPADQHYYQVSHDQYHMVLTPEAFIPSFPEADTQLVCLTPEVADRQSKFETAVIVDAAADSTADQAPAIGSTPEAQATDALPSSLAALMAKALHQQAQVLADSDLTIVQRKALLANMHAFFVAIQKLNER